LFIISILDERTKGANMRYMVRFNESLVPGLSFSSVCAGERGGKLLLWDDDVFEKGAIGFVIMDAEGNEVVKGSFYGPNTDRDVPLDIARRDAREKAEVALLQYDDGPSYKFDPVFGFAVPEARG